MCTVCVAGKFSDGVEMMAFCTKCELGKYQEIEDPLRAMCVLLDMEPKRMVQ